MTEKIKVQRSRLTKSQQKALRGLISYANLLRGHCLRDNSGPPSFRDRVTGKVQSLDDRFCELTDVLGPLCGMCRVDDDGE